MKNALRIALVGTLAVLTLIESTQALGKGDGPANPAQDKFVYVPVIQVAQLPCDANAVAQLKSVSRWQGKFTLAFKGNASGTWPGGDTEATSVDHALSLSSIVLTKTHDTATFVNWTMNQFVTAGQLIANDNDVYTYKIGGSSSMLAQFTAAAGSDVVSVVLYPDQCKLRFNLDGIAVGPVTGNLTPNDYFTLCAVLDIKSLRSGVQTLSTSVPVYLRGGGFASSYDDVRKAGLKCRVGGGDPNIGEELFSSKVAWVLDGPTTSGPRGKGDQSMGTALVTYTFTPLP